MRRASRVGASAGRAGTMRYLERTELAQGMRTNGCCGRGRDSVSVGALGAGLLGELQQPQPRSIEPAAEGAGWIARYAWSSKVDADGVRRPSDYHKVLLKRMKGVRGAAA
jgi:epoxyqueuosine reductase